MHAILLCRPTQIRAARPQLQRRRLRLIHAGRLLTDGTQLASWLGTLEERQQRAATKGKDEPDLPTLPSTLTPGPSAPGYVPWLNCSVGAPLSDGEEDSNDAQPQVRWQLVIHLSSSTLYILLSDHRIRQNRVARGAGSRNSQVTQIKPLRGFDRLAAAGFSEDDILNFRRQFHSRSAADYLSTAEFPTEEECASTFVFFSLHSPCTNLVLAFFLIAPFQSLTDEEHARALEEQWIDSLGSGTSASGGPADGDSRARAVLNGIIVGFFFPLLPFFFFRAPKPAAFWESGHALETPESTVFTYALPTPPPLCSLCFAAFKLTLNLPCELDGACRWAW
jgi:hypothetical protein